MEILTLLSDGRNTKKAQTIFNAKFIKILNIVLAHIFVSASDIFC